MFLTIRQLVHDQWERSSFTNTILLYCSGLSPDGWIILGMDDGRFEVINMLISLDDID